MTLLFGEFELDTTRGELRHAGRPLRIEPRALEVLAYLIEHRDRVVSQRELRDQIWRVEFASESTVPRAVSEARRALTAAGAPSHSIRTVYGHGYRFGDQVRSALDPRDQAAVRQRRSALGIALALAAALGWALWSGAEHSGTPAAAGLLEDLSSSPNPALCRHPLEALQPPPDVSGWTTRGWFHYFRVVVCEEDASELTPALAAAERALQVAPESTRAIALRAMVLADTGRAEEAYAALQPVLERLNGRDSEIEATTAYVLQRTGFLDTAALHLDRALANDPRWLDRHLRIPHLLLYRLEFGRFLDLLPIHHAAYIQFHRALGQVAGGHPEAARVTLARALETPAPHLYSRLCAALAAILDGRTDAAGTILHETQARLDARGLGDGEVTYKLAQLWALAGYQQQGLRALAGAVGQGFFPDRYLREDPLIANLRPLEGYRRAVAAAQLRTHSFGARFHLAPASPQDSSSLRR